MSEAISLPLYCPHCRTNHVDEGMWAERPHHVHQCQSCGHEWDEGMRTVGIKGEPSNADEAQVESVDGILIRCICSTGEDDQGVDWGRQWYSGMEAPWEWKCDNCGRTLSLRVVVGR